MSRYYSPEASNSSSEPDIPLLESVQSRLTRLPEPETVDELLPPLSDGLGPTSSPVKGHGQEAAEHRRRKGRTKGNKVLIACKNAKLAAAHTVEKAMFGELMKELELKKIHFGHFLRYVFNPLHFQGSTHYHKFMAKKGAITELLNWWSAAPYSKRVRTEIRTWAVNYVAQLIRKEAAKVTREGVLQSSKRRITGDLVRNYSLRKMSDLLEDGLAPVSMEMLTALATSRHSDRHTDLRKLRTKQVVASAALSCLGEYSHANNLPKRMNSLYLYASGAQRQTMTVLSSMGLAESFSNLTSKNVRRKNNAAGKEKTGTLRQVSESIRDEGRNVAYTGLHLDFYDNLNKTFKTPEQILGKHDSQQNGTCATMTPLFNASLEDLNLKNYQKRFLDAPPLTIDDIVHSPEESAAFRKNLIHTILRIIVKYGGDGFRKFENDLKTRQPASKDKIEVHTSKLYPLPPWHIDESSIVGNAEVEKAIVDELRLRDNPNFEELVRFVSGDQLSISRLRALELIRAGQAEGHAMYFWGIWITGLFHTKMADMQGTLLTHWGKPNTGERNPGSLWFHNTRLDRLPITTTSLPPFRTCRDLVFVSLYARVLQCLLLVSKCASLEEYVEKNPDWDTLVRNAESIFDTYANSATVEDLRWERRREMGAQDDEDEGPNKTKKPTQGDMVFENAVLFMRDALISREFTDAVKAGDSGRVLLVLKIWALSFRGNGRTKYAHEMLHLIHNLECVWDENIRRIVLSNWLLNPSGKDDSWVEVDLVQEHLNFWIKVWHSAHGSNHSWDWLAMVGPCVDVLRQLSRNYNSELGSNQGSRHAPPDLSNDIECLMKSLSEHRVYEICKGRVLDDDDEPVKDVIREGYNSLLAGPLDDYNTAFRRLQRRRRMKTVGQMVRDMKEKDSPENDPASSNSPAANSPSLSADAGVLSMDIDGELSGEGAAKEAEDDEGVAEDVAEDDVEMSMLGMGADDDEDDGLQCLTEADVAFDMDEVPVEEEDVLSDDSDTEIDEDEEESEGDVGMGSEGGDDDDDDSDGSMYVD